ncbi:hypothetical protein R3P38DRAFT_2416633, partial [Favolaschia claudopus]
WEVETGMTTAEFAATRPTAARVLEISSKIRQKYASGVFDSPPDPESTDHTHENFHLLVRDTLILHTLQNAILSADFGRAELLLGTLTMMFSGGGCSNYRTELLYFLQHLKKVWPERFANIVRDNALISTSGHSYVGVDKNIEFSINFQ